MRILSIFNQKNSIIYKNQFLMVIFSIITAISLSCLRIFDNHLLNALQSSCRGRAIPYSLSPERLSFALVNIFGEKMTYILLCSIDLSDAHVMVYWSTIGLLSFGALSWEKNV